MRAPTIDQTDATQKNSEASVEVDSPDVFELDITFIENTPASDSILLCSTGDNCGSSCPSACTTS